MTNPEGCHLFSTCMHTQVHMYLDTQNHTHSPHSATLFRTQAEIRGEMITETGLRFDLLDIFFLIGWIFIGIQQNVTSNTMDFVL